MTSVKIDYVWTELSLIIDKLTTSHTKAEIIEYINTNHKDELYELINKYIYEYNNIKLSFIKDFFLLIDYDLNDDNIARYKESNNINDLYIGS